MEFYLDYEPIYEFGTLRPWAFHLWINLSDRPYGVPGRLVLRVFGVTARVFWAIPGAYDSTSL